MKKLMIAAVATFASVIASAAITVTDVTTTQRWPWSRLIDVDFVVDCAATEKYAIALSAKNGETDLPAIPKTALVGDLIVGAGLHRVTIDPIKAGFPEEVMTRFAVTVTPDANPSPAYMIVDLVSGEKTYNYNWGNDFTWYNTDEYKKTKMVFRHVLPGSFVMGAYDNEHTDEWGDMPAHKVTLTADFWLGVFELTTKQYNTICGTSVAGNDTDPVVNVSWGDNVRGGSSFTQFTYAQSDNTSFCKKLYAKSGLLADLPTEAQWEYACRAGTHAPYYDASIPLYNAKAKEICRCKELTADDGVVAFWAVGKLRPNAWGFYDMLGNAREWIFDGNSSGSAEDAVDPVVNPSYDDQWRILTRPRGGSYNDTLKGCRCASRPEYLSAWTTGYSTVGCRISVKYEL